MQGQQEDRTGLEHDAGDGPDRDRVRRHRRESSKHAEDRTDLGGLEIPDGVRDSWFNDPVGFIVSELGAEPWEKQVEIIEAVRDHPRVAVRSCNGAGKTYIAAYVVLWWLACFRDAMVITTAPTEHQVRDVLWREIRRAYRGHEDLFNGKLLRTSLEIGDKHYAQGLSTDTPERFQGFHEGHILFVVDEASGVRDGIFEAIEGSMTSAGARMLLVGNPTALTGMFYEAFHRRRSLWRTVHISALDTPNLKAGEVINPALVTPRWVDEAEVNWGIDSPMYQVRVLGEFPSEMEDTLISLRHVEAAIERWRTRRPGESRDPGKTADGVHAESLEDRPLRGRLGPDLHRDDEGVEIGVDIARFGNDKTVICIRRGDFVLEIAAYAKQDTMTTAGRIAEAAKRYSPRVIRVDEIGIGAGVVDRLRELKLPGVEGVNVSVRALAKPEQFANLRAELYDGLRQRFQDGRIAIPDDRDLVGDLASLRYAFTSSGQVKIEDKDEARARGVPSPDRADALMLAFGTGAKRPWKIWV